MTYVLFSLHDSPLFIPSSRFLPTTGLSSCYSQPPCRDPMVPFSLLLLLLLSSVEEVTASVLLGRQRPPSQSGTTLVLDKRQGTTVFTTFSAIFRDGDASRPRIAGSGYDIRVDVVNSVWGFCGTNNPSKCGMAGACFDSFSCSAGCGFRNTALKTLTW